jgi:hypothetical protein
VHGVGKIKAVKCASASSGCFPMLQNFYRALSPN